MLRKIGRRLTYANLLAVTTAVAVAVAGCGGRGDTADKASTSPVSTTSRDLQAAWQRFQTGRCGAHCLNSPSGFHSSTAAMSM